MSTDVSPAEQSSQPPQQRLLGGPPTRWPVFLSAIILTSAMALWAIIDKAGAESAISTVVGKVTTGFGWFYILLATVVLGFVIFLGVSRHGHVRLGPDHSRPEFSTFAWASMLFAAGIGTDVMFYSVVEPVTQYMAPPTGDPETVAAAREATVWTLFHYGITGWAMYALMGLALGYFAYRLDLPLAVRSALYPIFGKRIDGPIGHAVDTAAVLGTVFGVATSLGIGVVFLNVGLNELFGLGIGTGAQVGLAVLAVAIAAVSATTGVDKGIRILSQLNVILALALAAWVLVTGRTTFILEAVVLNVGDFARTFPAKTMETFAFVDNDEWMSLWTLFFWAWWIAWASFVGMFLARISRGRTIRQFVLGTMVIPFSYIVMWISVFGNAAIDRVRSGDADFAASAQEFDGSGFFVLLEDFPATGMLVALATFVGLLFYVTSADSGALVMSNLSSRLRSVQDDGAPWMRIVWAAITGLLTIAMLAVGGILALQYATIIFAVPFAFVLDHGHVGPAAGPPRRGAPGRLQCAPAAGHAVGAGQARRRGWRVARPPGSGDRVRRRREGVRPLAPGGGAGAGGGRRRAAFVRRRVRAHRRRHVRRAAHHGCGDAVRLPGRGVRVAGAHLRGADDRRPGPLCPARGTPRRRRPGLRRHGLHQEPGHPRLPGQVRAAPGVLAHGVNGRSHRRMAS